MSGVIKNHKRVCEYDGSFKCLDCGAGWGALPGHPTMPDICDTRIIITLEEIQEIQAKRTMINNFDLSSIRFTENGKDININKDLIQEFEFTGLSNIDFITSGFYINGWDAKDD